MNPDRRFLFSLLKDFLAWKYPVIYVNDVMKVLYLLSFSTLILQRKLHALLALNIQQLPKC
jgi:hypothetical protein